MAQEDQEGRVDYVEFPATDLAAVKKFYGDVFGWSFTDYGEAYTSFQDGRLSGGFRTDASPGKGGVLIVLYTARLEETCRKVASAGCTIVREIFEFPGGRRFHFADPSGNELAVWSDR